MGDLRPPIGGEHELRRDRTFSSCSHLFRIYLDNFDELKKVDRGLAELLKGTASKSVEHLRDAYAECGLPVHPKKSVQQQLQTGIQGAWVDGDAGTMCAKPSKMGKYVALALEVITRGKATQRELQVVGGGLVYIAMFKRPMLSGLNQLWKKIVALDKKPPSFRALLGKEVVCELARFIGLLPLAFTSFRYPFDDQVTASDASTTGGGICVSKGVSPFGAAAALSTVRGDVPEEHDFCQILSIGLFDGISGLRVALDCLGLPVGGHVSVEKDESARRVVESFFPDSVFVDDVEKIDDRMVSSWALQFGRVGVVLLGGGPPCQGVSGLNAERRGALRDHRSCLFKQIRRIVGLCRKHFPWAQVQVLIENVASMDYEDCKLMNEEYELDPWFIDANEISLAHRPRLYWVSWEINTSGPGETMLPCSRNLPTKGEIKLTAQVNPQDYLEKGWNKSTSKPLPTFTTSRPSPVEHRRPAGLKSCQEHERQRWKDHSHRFPPYQYKDENGLWNRKGDFRLPSVEEREAIMGFPIGYTKQCMAKGRHGSSQHQDCRLSLLGNSWSIPVVAWLLSKLFSWLGLMKPLTLQEIVKELCPGSAGHLQGLLLRPPIGHSTKTLSASTALVQKIAGLVSRKGEDVLLRSQTEIPAKYHRLRSSLPARLWRWRTVAGWKWQGNEEHINALELRAVLTSVRWRVETLGQFDVRCLHLVDSLVVLHSLTRGRSSSRKLKRTLLRISAYLLATGLQPLWGYVDTKQNPADRPSRRPVRKKWLKRSRRWKKAGQRKVERSWERKWGVSSP